MWDEGLYPKDNQELKNFEHSYSLKKKKLIIMIEIGIDCQNLTLIMIEIIVNTRLKHYCLLVFLYIGNNSTYGKDWSVMYKMNRLFNEFPCFFK
jgi:hypothetical protein